MILTKVSGMSNGSGLFFQDLGIGYADGNTYWGQVLPQKWVVAQAFTTITWWRR